MRHVLDIPGQLSLMSKALNSPDKLLMQGDEHARREILCKSSTACAWKDSADGLQVSASATSRVISARDGLGLSGG